MQKTAFTTGDVAGICGVSADTVSRWFDLGQIEGYRLGPGGDRRIPREKLRTFMLKHGIPLERLEGERATILILEEEKHDLDLIAGALRQIEGFGVVPAQTVFECGLRLVEYKPLLVILSVDTAGLNLRQVCHTVKSRPETQYTAILGLADAGEVAETADWAECGLDAVLGKPLTAEQIVDKVRELLTLPPGKIARPKHPIAV